MTIAAPIALAQGTRAPIPFTDENGIACLRVPLDVEGRNYATIEREDYDHITQTLGCRAAWCLTQNGSGNRYVVVNPPQVPGRSHGLISVARLFTGAQAGQVVRYATSDRLDLRRCNPVLSSGTGRARHDCGEWLAEVVQERRARRDATKARCEAVGARADVCPIPSMHPAYVPSMQAGVTYQEPKT